VFLFSASLPFLLRILQAQPGVESASVNFAISKATVQFDLSKVRCEKCRSSSSGSSIIKQINMTFPQRNT
jgi:hypothetical protein